MSYFFLLVGGIFQALRRLGINLGFRELHEAVLGILDSIK